MLVSKAYKSKCLHTSAGDVALYVCQCVGCDSGQLMVLWVAGYIGCWDNGYGVITRKFAGNIEGFKVVTMQPTIIVSEAAGAYSGTALLESVDYGTLDVQ
eukprot:2344327-Amphidinium_carterae.1